MQTEIFNYLRDANVQLHKVLSKLIQWTIWVASCVNQFEGINFFVL